jgi:tRNA dimethylallyltransferase
MPETPILIAGPTASGKSALALTLAEELGGIVINADAMQVYRDLRVMTARPTPADEARVPHRLYGVLDAAEPGSVGAWLAPAEEALAEARRIGRRPIVVGGSGLYFRALTEGLSPIPSIPASHREEARALHDQIGADAFRARLGAHDPDAAARIAASDTQRLLRAWAVFAATGRPLSQWQKLQGQPLAGSAVRVVVEPDREGLYAAIEARLDAMVAGGGLEEVRRLLARRLDPGLPAMKALGVPQFRAVLEGEKSLEEAVEAAKTATRRYAKRQMTWFRNQMMSWERLISQDSERIKQEIFILIRNTP